LHQLVFTHNYANINPNNSCVDHRRERERERDFVIIMSQNDRIELQAMAILRRRVKKLSIASEKAPQTYGWVFSLM
jgi:hypothetical protein